MESYYIVGLIYGIFAGIIIGCLGMQISMDFIKNTKGKFRLKFIKYPIFLILGVVVNLVVNLFIFYSVKDFTGISVLLSIVVMVICVLFSIFIALKLKSERFLTEFLVSIVVNIGLYCMYTSIICAVQGWGNQGELAYAGYFISFSAFTMMFAVAIIQVYDKPKT